MNYFIVGIICVGCFFAGAHFGMWLNDERVDNPHFLKGEEFDKKAYCEYDEAYCITGKPDPDLTHQEIQYYCMLLDDSQRPPFCFKDSSFTYQMTSYLKEETRILALCFDSDLTIPNCNMMSGKINSTYGELK